MASTENVMDGCIGARDPYREVGMDVPPLTDAQVETMGTTLIAKGMIRIIALEAEIRALQTRGDTLAAAVERDHGQRCQRHMVLGFEDCPTPACHAARAWREARR